MQYQKMTVISFNEFVGIEEITELLENEDDLEETFKNEVFWFFETSEVAPLNNDKLTIYKEIDGGNVFATYNNELVGGYCESILWIDPKHRGKNIGYLLLDAASKARNNCLNSESFTYAGLMLHLKYYINKFNENNHTNISDAKLLIEKIDNMPIKSFFDLN